MINNDKKEKAESMFAVAEYLASFINPSAVSKIKEARKEAENKNFASDNEFKSMLDNKEFLKDLANRAPKEEQKNNLINKRKSIRETKLPKNLGNIMKINRDNF